MRETPFRNFSCWNHFFYDCQCLKCTVEQRRIHENHVAYRWLLFTLLAVETYNLSSKLPTKTHQLHYPASRTSFSGIITSCRKTAVVLKLRKVIFAKFFTSTAKCWQAHLITGLQLMAVIENIPVNIKKQNEMCQEMFFFIVLATAISGMPTLQICFLPGKFRLTILTREHHGESLSVCELDTQPSNWEADTLPLAYRRPSEIFLVNA